MRISVKELKKPEQVLYAFALGDALSYYMTSKNLNDDEITAQWSALDPLGFSNRTFLLFSTWIGLKAISREMIFESISAERFRVELTEYSCKFLHSFQKTSNFRDASLDTWDAIEQMHKHFLAHSSFSNFKLKPKITSTDPAKDTSVCLARILPLFVYGLDTKMPSALDFKKFIDLTHISPDAYLFLEDLKTYLTNGRFKRSFPWLRERIHPDLGVAIQSLKNSRTPLEAFLKSQRSGLRNKSTGALTLALWVWKNGWSEELEEQTLAMPNPPYELET